MTYYKCGSIHPTQNSNVVIDTASGPIANFETPLAMPLLDAQVDVNAVQDLHGQSGAYPAGGSAQKWDEEWELGSIDNQTGQDTDNNNVYRSKNYIPVPQGENLYLFNGKSDTLGLRFYDSNKDFIGSRAFLTSKVMVYNTYDLPEGTAYIRFINTSTNVYLNNVSINYPSTDTAYHPYANICPMNGWDEIKLGYVDFNQLARLDTSPRQGITATMDADGVISLSGVATNTYSNITKIITPLVNHIYFIIKSVVDNPNNISFNWSFLNAVKSPYITGTPETQYAIFKVVSESGASTGISGFAVDTDFTGVKIKVSCIDLTQLLGSDIANYLYSLSDYGATIIKQLLTKDYYPYNEGGTMVTLDSVNGEPTSQNAVINLNDTYYGGKLIQDKDGKRKFEVTHGIVDIGELNWSRSNNAGTWEGYLFYFQISDKVNGGNLKCSKYKYDIYSLQTMPDKRITRTGSSKYVYIRDDDYTTIDAFKNANIGEIILYELETPYTIDLPDGTSFKSLPGVNNIFADTGDTAVKFRKIQTTG